VAAPAAPIPTLPSTYSVHDFHSYGFHGTGVTPGLHFHLAASINETGTWLSPQPYRILALYPSQPKVFAVKFSLREFERIKKTKKKKNGIFKP